MVVRFEGGDGAKKIGPVKQTKVLREQVGEIKFARVLDDGNLLIGCKDE